MWTNNTTDLTAAGFTAADLTAADFTAADFTAVDFTAVDFTSADFTAEDFTAADFTAVELNCCRLCCGLYCCRLCCGLYCHIRKYVDCSGVVAKWYKNGLVIKVLDPANVRTQKCLQCFPPNQLCITVCNINRDCRELSVYIFFLLSENAVLKMTKCALTH
jgi:hypothetical protein